MVIRHEDAPTFQQGGVTARGYAAPSRGARDLSLWRLQLVPGERSPEHVLSREEVFLCTEGSACATLDGVDARVGPRDCLVVPAGTSFVLTAGPAGFGAVCAMPAGATATILPAGTTVTPPWAA
jgi:mannose-6-phosphate isomerase-like protein (cupin superfamily)